MFCLQGNAVFDFTGTGYESHGNCNAPRAVALSALIYCLRSMVKHDIPLNQVQYYFLTVLLRVWQPRCLLFLKAQVNGGGWF